MKFDFDNSEAGAEFSACRKFRYALWRIWDRSKPLAMFIGLNPSTANETDADPTIRSVARICRHNGYGGFYMMNCFPLVSTDPKALKAFEDDGLFDKPDIENEEWLHRIESKCKAVVFAWGNFQIVKDYREEMMIRKFPNAKALAVNKNGSPKHPLYCRADTSFIPFRS